MSRADAKTALDKTILQPTTPLELLAALERLVASGVITGEPILDKHVLAVYRGATQLQRLPDPARALEDLRADLLRHFQAEYFSVSAFLVNYRLQRRLVRVADRQQDAPVTSTAGPPLPATQGST